VFEFDHAGQGDAKQARKFQKRLEAVRLHFLPRVRVLLATHRSSLYTLLSTSGHSRAPIRQVEHVHLQLWRARWAWTTHRVSPGGTRLSLVAWSIVSCVVFGVWCGVHARCGVARLTLATAASFELMLLPDVRAKCVCRPLRSRVPRVPRGASGFAEFATAASHAHATTAQPCSGVHRPRRDAGVPNRVHGTHLMLAASNELAL